jgi:hypothetical protein
LGFNYFAQKIITMWSSHITNDSNAATVLSRSKVEDGDKVSIYPYLRVISSTANKIKM